MNSKELSVVIEFGGGLARPDFEQAIALADSVIEKTRETGDPYYALDFLMKVERLRDMTAITKAKILHFLHRSWEEFGIDAPFFDTVQMYVGLGSKLVIQRYIAIWSMFESGKIPPRVQESLKSRPIKDLVPIMGAINQGYKFTDEHWDKIINAQGFAEVAQIVREEVKGIEPRTHAISYYLDRRDGSLYAVNQGRKIFIGKLDIKTSDPVGRAAILRVVNKIGIQLYDLEVNE